MGNITHYGVLGMRWGIRKDRKTGTYTRKPSKKEQKYQKEREAVLENPRKLAKRKLRRYYNISDEEAQKQLKMFNLEKQLRDVSRAELNRGKQTVDLILGYTETARKAYGLYNEINTKMKSSKSSTQKAAEKVVADVIYKPKASSSKKKKTSSRTTALALR